MATNDIPYHEFRDKLREIMVAYLESDEIKIARYKGSVIRLADHTSDPYLKDCAQDVILFLTAVYQHYIDMFELLYGIRKPTTPAEAADMRSKQTRCMRATKSLFKKGMKFTECFC